jgi:hypothetical protein
MQAINIYIRILSLVLFGSVLRTLFQIAYLGASREHHGFGPDVETRNYMLIALYFLLLMIWSIVIIRKNELPFRVGQVVGISLMVIPAMIYMAMR